jgi:CSLREA domain-containing protein
MTARVLLAPLLAVLLLAVAAPAALADSYVVNATDDNPGTCTTTHCSLRQAITSANAGPAPDVIDFNLPVTFTLHCVTKVDCITTYSTSPIQLTTGLPPIVFPVTIDGRTQPHFAGPPLVEIRGPGSSNLVEGLRLAPGSDHSVIRSLAVTSFEIGIVVASSTDVVAGNRLGVDMTGAARGNFIGSVVEGDNNSIGGASTVGDGNVISGNVGDGVVFCQACAELGSQAPATPPKIWCLATLSALAPRAPPPCRTRTA